ncbi:hypothetical protein V7S43_011757 [Phytophthora oleae]|uniref:Uncharacterized protein n=1 Tax=Phytophthora oleae TaxID=2107226 RepID=A0ABD3FAA8_9STRA
MIGVVKSNVLVSGSGVQVNTGFELAAICCQIAQVVGGLEQKVSPIKSQQMNIKEDTEAFRWVLALLGCVQNQNQLTERSQKLILKFQAEVKEYERVLDKFTKKSQLKQPCSMAKSTLQVKMRGKPKRN